MCLILLFFIKIAFEFIQLNKKTSRKLASNNLHINIIYRLFNIFILLTGYYFLLFPLCILSKDIVDCSIRKYKYKLFTHQQKLLL